MYITKPFTTPAVQSSQGQAPMKTPAASETTDQPRLDSFTYTASMAADAASPPRAQNASSRTAKEALVALMEQREAAALALEKRQREQEAKQAREAAKENAENAKAEAERMAEMLETMLICFKIAARITKGDKVPQEDVRYLMKHDPELFASSMSMRRPNEDPEDHDSLVPEEESEQINDGVPKSASAAPTEALASASAGSSGGGASGATSGGADPSGSSLG